MSETSERLAAVPAAVRPIVRAARQVVRSVAPQGTQEIACPGERPRSPSMMWKLVRYAVRGKVVVTIGTFTKHASIFFARGNELADPRALLEGGGKSLRYITLRVPGDARRAEVKAIVRRAFALASREPAHRRRFRDGGLGRRQRAERVEERLDRRRNRADEKPKRRRMRRWTSAPPSTARRPPRVIVSSSCCEAQPRSRCSRGSRS
jgi:Domain of unknown function (DU1801)